MSLFFWNHEVAIYRNRQLGAANKWTMSATGTIELADITPASLERTEFENGPVGKTYVAYMEPGTDVKEGDIIIVRDSTTLDSKRYTVKSVSRWEGFGVVDSKELTIVSRD